MKKKKKLKRKKKKKEKKEERGEIKKERKKKKKEKEPAVVAEWSNAEIVETTFIFPAKSRMLFVFVQFCSVISDQVDILQIALNC